MNDGYLTIMIFLITIILLVTGWKRQVAGEMSSRILALLTAASIICIPITIDCGAFVLQGSILPGLLWAIYSLMRSRPAVHVLFLIVSLFLLLSIWVWMKRIYTADPVFVLFNEQWDAPLAAGMITAILIRRYDEQVILLFVTLIAGQAFLSAVGQAGPQMVGNWELWDDFAMGIVVSRLVNALVLGILHIRTTGLRKSFRQRGNTES